MKAKERILLRNLRKFVEAAWTAITDEEDGGRAVGYILEARKVLRELGPSIEEPVKAEPES